MQLKEFCERMGVKYRDARYVLEQGFVPRGVDPSPDRGNRRDLSDGDAFWLAMVLTLKAVGFKVPSAVRMTEFAFQAVRGAAGNAGWDRKYNPFYGKFETEYEWAWELGDGSCGRLTTTSHPSQSGRLFTFPWVKLPSRDLKPPEYTPVIVVRVDLVELARRVRAE